MFVTAILPLALRPRQGSYVSIESPDNLYYRYQKCFKNHINQIKSQESQSRQIIQMIRNISKRLFPFFLITLAAGCAHKTATSIAKIPAEQNSLLWEINGNGLKTPSYLYGTIHLIPVSDFFITEPTKKALSAARRVTFEINIKDMTDPSALFNLLNEATMKDGKKLRDLLNDQDYKIVQSKFEKTGFPLKMFERLKPMFLSAMLESGGKDDSGAAKAATTSYEMEFMKIADTQHKTFGGLETAEFQLSIFDSIPYEKQAAMLVKEIKTNDGSDRDELKKMIDIYKTQNITALNQMIQSGDSEISGYEDILLANRNKHWIPVMQKMMQQEPVFFAVGAGHLGGEKGVIRLLRKAGYTVKAAL